MGLTRTPSACLRQLAPGANHDGQDTTPKSRSANCEDEIMKHAYTWGAILAVVLASTTGDVLLSRAMKRVGDVGALWRRAGLLTVAGRILRSPSFLLGILMMALAFFSLLFALSWADVSLVAPASASLTFVANAI